MIRGSTGARVAVVAVGKISVCWCRVWGYWSHSLDRFLTVLARLFIWSKAS